MLRFYPVILEVLRELRGPIAQVERRNRNLAGQLERSAARVLLNVAEGSYSRGKNRQARYHNALGSAREAMAYWEAAEALGYIRAVNAALVGRFDHIIGTLVRVVGSG